MGLLQNKPSVQAKPLSQPKLPDQQQPKSRGQKPLFGENHLSVSDGWNFGIGFGLALTVALPLLLAVFGCFLWVVILIFGGMLAGIIGG